MSMEHEHSWIFMGDDPYIKCDCGTIKDALTGRVIRTGGES